MNRFTFALSYCGEDRDLAEKLAENLRSRGFSVFTYVKYEDLLLGKELKKILKIIYASKSEHVIALCSAAYLRASRLSDWNSLAGQDSETLISEMPGGRNLRWTALEYAVARMAHFSRLQGGPEPPTLIPIPTESGGLPPDAVDERVVPTIRPGTVDRVIDWLLQAYDIGSDKPKCQRDENWLIQEVEEAYKADVFCKDYPPDEWASRLFAERRTVLARIWAPHIECGLRLIAKRLIGWEFSPLGVRRWAIHGPGFDGRLESRRFPDNGVYWCIVDLRSISRNGHDLLGGALSCPARSSTITISQERGFHGFGTESPEPIKPLNVDGLALALSALEAAGIASSPLILERTDRIVEQALYRSSQARSRLEVIGLSVAHGLHHIADRLIHRLTEHDSV